MRRFRPLLRTAAAAGAAATAGYLCLDHYASRRLRVDPEWPLRAKLYADMGVVFHELGDADGAVLSLNRTLRVLGEARGHCVDRTDPREAAGKFVLLPAHELRQLSGHWQQSYVDAVLLLALSKHACGDLDNSFKLLAYSLVVPINRGSVDLRSQSLRLLAQIYADRFQDLRSAEEYLVDCVKYNEIHKDLDFQQLGGSLKLNPGSQLDQEVFDALLQLSSLKLRLHQPADALGILHSLLQALKPPVDSDNNKSRLYTQFGLVHQSQNDLAQASACYNTSLSLKIDNVQRKLVLETLRSCYSPDQQEYCEISDILNTLDIQDSNERKYWLLKSLFLTDD